MSQLRKDGQQVDKTLNRALAPVPRPPAVSQGRVRLVPAAHGLGVLRPERPWASLPRDLRRLFCADVCRAADAPAHPLAPAAGTREL